MTSTLIISPLAQEDLKNIHRYGTLNWGEHRASVYLDSLKDQFWHLTEHPKMGIEREELLPAMRSLPVESHVVFYRFIDQQVEIVRVLHGRQDPQKRFK